MCASVAALVLGMTGGAAAQAREKNPGTSEVCGTFTVSLDLLFFDIPLDHRADEGWAWVDTAQKMRSAIGEVHGMGVASNDTPANHDSHDVDFELRLDPDQEDLLTIIQSDSLGIEWESGLDALRDLTGEGARTFPKWIWPSNGDRVWVNGSWILDCGHPDTSYSPHVYHAEIHPPRAFASMRDQAAPLPGTGATPVPVTLTDLFISGRGGYTPQVLNCGPDIILGPYGDSCGTSTPPPNFESKKTTPINDTDFSFDVCLPPRPPNTVFGSRVETGPGNTVAIEPQLKKVPAAGACVGPFDPFLGPRFDQNWMLHVTVPLKDTDTAPTEVLARRIYAGWIAVPDPVLRHRKLTLNSVDLHEDHDFGTPGQLTFWWMNVNVAPFAWLRLSDFANDDMDSFGGYIDDSDQRTFAGANFDFYLRNSPRDYYSVASRGYEQDCYDHLIWLDGHYLNAGKYIYCEVNSISDNGADDPIGKADALYYPGTLGSQTLPGGGDYDLHLTIDEVPITDEDRADISVSRTVCTPAGEVALVGQPLTCRTHILNAGPGLPRRAVARNTFSGVDATVNSGTWTYSFPFGDFDDPPCATAGAEARCDLGTVPASGAGDLTVTATPTAAGLLTEQATASTDSTDPDVTNNAAATTVEVFRSVTIDIQPGDSTNVVQLKRGGLISVAILSTPQFNASTVDSATVCFGDAEAPAERTCAEVHGRGHLVDVNRDGRADMVLHYDVSATGIDLGDHSACLKGRTTAGVGIYGCDAVSPQ